MLTPIRKLAFQSLLVLLLSAFIAETDVSGQTNSSSRKANAQDGATAGRETVKQKRLPYRGKVVAVDKAARCITVGKRTFHLTSETKLLKGSQTVRLEQLVTGEMVTGSYTKATDGKLLAATVYVGGKNTADKSK